MRLALVLVTVATMLASCGGRRESVPEELLLSIPVTGGELNTVRGGDLCDIEATSGPVVLLLHGASFNATTWVETGTHQRLCEAGILSLSVDLPGFGRSARFDHDPVRLLDEVVSYIAADVILVSPSMSGNYSLPWLATDPPAAAGFVPVAPVGISSWVTPEGFAVPTLGIWGGDDTVVAVGTGEALIASIPGATLEVINGGGHAVYKTNPDEFHEALMRFVVSLSS